MNASQKDPQKPFEVRRTEHGQDVRFTVVANTDPVARIAVVTVRLARITDTGAERARVRIKADAWYDPKATDTIADALSRAHSRVRESEKRPEGMVDLFWGYSTDTHVRFLTDGYTTGIPDSKVAACRPKFIPAGYYGFFWGSSPATWDWERSEVMYHIGTICPGAFASTRLATADEFEVYDGDPREDKLRTTPHRPLIDLDGNRIEVTA